MTNQFGDYSMFQKPDIAQGLKKPCEYVVPFVAILHEEGTFG